MGQGHIRTRTHDYYRHGTVTLFAALDYLSGKVFAHTAPRHRHQEWLAFLRKIDKEVAPELGLHIICDNYSTHKHAKVTAWLKRHPRFHLHFIPTSSSWLNLVERFFGEITAKVIRPGSFRSVGALVADIFRFLDHHNRNPKPYRWTADPNRILEKLDRAWEAMLEEIQSYLRDVTLAPGRKLLRLNQPWSLAGKCSLAVRLSAIHFTALSRAADNSLSSGTGIISISIKSPHM